MSTHKRCPKCGGYNIKAQVPIVMEEIKADDSVKQILAKWARARKSGATPIKGVAFIMCFDCGHEGPKVDCTGMTAEQVSSSPAIFVKMKSLWNSQPKEER